MLAQAQSKYKQGFHIQTIKHPNAVYNNTEPGETDDHIAKIATAVFVSKFFAPYVYDKQFNITFGNVYNSKTKELAITAGSDIDCIVDIVIDEKKWKNMSTLQKFYLVWHELGHDILNLDHMRTGIMREQLPHRNFLTPDIIFRDLERLRKYTFKNKISYGKRTEITDEKCELEIYTIN